MKVTLLALALRVVASAAHAQGGKLVDGRAECISSLYDSAEYGWYAVHNSCNEHLDVRLCHGSTGQCTNDVDDLEASSCTVKDDVFLAGTSRTQRRPSRHRGN